MKIFASSDFSHDGRSRSDPAEPSANHRYPPTAYGKAVYQPPAYRPKLTMASPLGRNVRRRKKPSHVRASSSMTKLSLILILILILILSLILILYHRAHPLARRCMHVHLKHHLPRERRRFPYPESHLPSWRMGMSAQTQSVCSQGIHRWTDGISLAWRYRSFAYGLVRQLSAEVWIYFGAWKKHEESDGTGLLNPYFQRIITNCPIFCTSFWNLQLESILIKYLLIPKKISNFTVDITKNRLTAEPHFIASFISYP